ncbi:MAG: hypothetical protein WCK53_15435 [Methanomicrobiales archaeon]
MKHADLTRVRFTNHRYSHPDGVAEPAGERSSGPENPGYRHG